MIRMALTRRPNSIGQGLVLGMDSGAVAEAVQFHHLFGKGDSGVRGFGPQNGQHRAELLPGQRLVPANRGHLGQDDRRLLRHREAGVLGDPHRALADDGRD